MEVQATSDSDLALTLFEAHGEQLGYADLTVEGSEVVSANVISEGPQFLVVEQYLPEVSEFRIRSSHRLAPIDDPDDGSSLIIGVTITGTLDYPGDVDWYSLDLDRRQEIVVTVDATAVDPVVAVGPAGFKQDAYYEDDDSARGILGSNAELSYLAYRGGEHIVVVRSFSYDEVGSYLLTVEALED